MGKPTARQLANLMAMRDKARRQYEERQHAVSEALRAAGDDKEVLYDEARTINRERAKE